MKTSYVLIDFENVQVKSLALLKGDHFRVKVFLGPKNSKVPVELVVAMQELGKRAGYVVLGVSGANALDFHITYYLGKYTAQDPEGHFHIISKDTGFDSLIKHLNSKGIHCKRSASIELMAGVAPVAATAKAVAAPKKQAAAHKPKAAPKVAVPKATPNTTAAVKAPVASTNGLQSIIDNLQSRGTARPRTVKTLTSSIKSLRLSLSEEQIATTITELQALGKIHINGVQVTYKL